MKTIKNTYRKSLRKTSGFKLPLFFVLALSIIVLTCTFISISASGKVSTGNKYFTTIKVEEGDTLWSIADSYCTIDYSDYNEYIDEVKSINNMHDNNIKKGSYLVVPYFK